MRCASIAELVFGTFLDETVTVGIKQFFQLFYLAFQFGTLVGVPYHHTLGAHFHDLRGAHNVRPVLDSFFGRCERFVLYQLESPAVEHQGVARYSGRIMICLGEAAVDDHQFAIGFDGCLSASHAYRDVAVDDVAVLPRDTERIENHVADFLVVPQSVVVPFLFGMGGFVLQEIAFESSHFGFVEQGGVHAAPQIPKIVDGKLPFFGLGVAVESGTQDQTYLVQQSPSFDFFSVDVHFLQASVGIERYGSVEQQIGVEYPVHASVGEQALYVFVQLVAHAERMVQFVDQFLFFGCKPVGGFRVDGGEITVAHGIFLSVAHENFSFKINVFQLFPFLHVPFGAAVYHGSFELELDNADGLVHLCDEAPGFLVMPRVVFVQLRPEIMAGVVGVCFHGERGKRHQIDAVTVFQCGEVAVTERQAQHVGNATVVAGCRPHPKRVVVAPLYVEVVVIAQCVHDDVRSGAAVEDVAEDVQLVDAQALYQVADGADEFISPSGGHDGLDDAVEVGLFVVVLRGLVQ